MLQRKGVPRGKDGPDREIQGTGWREANGHGLLRERAQGKDKGKWQEANASKGKGQWVDCWWVGEWDFLGRLCQRSPPILRVSLLCAGSSQRRAAALAVGRVRPSGHPILVLVAPWPPTPKGSEWRSASRRRRLQTRSSHHGVMPKPPPQVVTNTDLNNTMKSTRAPSSSRGVQRGLSEMPDVATQAHRGPCSQGSDHGSKSHCTGTEKRVGERHLPSRSNSSRKGTHHVVKHPDQGDKGASKGPYTPPPNTGQHRQPNNNSLLWWCGESHYELGGQRR